MKIRIILLFFFLTTTFYRTGGFNIVFNTIQKVESKEKQNYTELYDKTIEYIKDHEGFVDTAYYCPALKKTIGYGHLITEKDSTLTKINKKQAEDLLKKDFDYAVKYVKSTTNLEGAKLLAMSHFVFCLGSGNFMKGPYKQIKNGKLPKIILEFCNYKKDSIIYKNQNLYNQRKWELAMFEI